MSLSIATGSLNCATPTLFKCATLQTGRTQPTPVTASATVAVDTYTSVAAAAAPVVLTTPATPAQGDSFVVKYVSGDDVSVSTPPSGTPPVSTVIYKFTDADTNQAANFVFDGVKWVKQ